MSGPVNTFSTSTALILSLLVFVSVHDQSFLVGNLLLSGATGAISSSAAACRHYSALTL